MQQSKHHNGRLQTERLKFCTWSRGSVIPELYHGNCVVSLLRLIRYDVNCSPSIVVGCCSVLPSLKLDLHNEQRCIRGQRGWLAEISVQRWSLSSHWCHRGPPWERIEAPGWKVDACHRAGRPPNLWRRLGHEFNNSLPIWWWFMASSPVVEGEWWQRATNMVMCDGRQVTVDRVAWCEHETHYIYT
jgi:hypothetical protein